MSYCWSVFIVRVAMVESEIGLANGVAFENRRCWKCRKKEGQTIYSSRINKYRKASLVQAEYTPSNSRNMSEVSLFL